MGNAATVEHTVKVDTHRPRLTSAVSPPMNRDGRSNAASTTVSFPCDDPVPGSGVANPPPAVILTEETAGTRVGSAGCADVGTVRSGLRENSVRGVMVREETAGTLVTWPRPFADLGTDDRPLDFRAPG